MKLTDDMIKRIKQEIEIDPEHIGYEGKTDEEISILLSSTVYKQRIVIEGTSSPINRILDGIKDSPNFVTKDDVALIKSII